MLKSILVAIFLSSALLAQSVDREQKVQAIFDLRSPIDVLEKILSNPLAKISSTPPTTACTRYESYQERSMTACCACAEAGPTIPLSSGFMNTGAVLISPSKQTASAWDSQGTITDFYSILAMCG